MTEEHVDQLSTDHFDHITILEEMVCSKGLRTRHFTFELPESCEPFYGYNPELGPEVSVWQVLLGDIGVLFCNHHSDHGQVRLDKLLIVKPNFIELVREFETVKVLLLANGLKTTEPILCWIRGLLHAFMAENPNVIQCSATLTATSGVG